MNMNTFRKAVDSLFAGLALICLMPVLAAVAAIILLGSPGPILINREFARRDGSRFQFCRFRTTRADGSEINAASRIVRRLHLDLLPVLWNVGRGDLPMTDIVLANRM